MAHVRASELWSETLRDAPRGVLRRIDWAALASYVAALDRYARLEQTQRQLDEGRELPFLIKGSHGPMLSPYLRAMNHCIWVITRLQVETGFNPGALRLARHAGR